MRKSAENISTVPVDMSKKENKEILADLVKHILQFILGQCGAFHIFHRTQFSRHTLSVLFLNRLHSLLGQLLTHLWIVTEICLRADNQARDTGTMVVNFWEPFFANVFKRSR